MQGEFRAGSNGIAELYGVTVACLAYADRGNLCKCKISYRGYVSYEGLLIIVVGAPMWGRDAVRSCADRSVRWRSKQNALSVSMMMLHRSNHEYICRRIEFCQLIQSSQEFYIDEFEEFEEWKAGRNLSW